MPAIAASSALKRFRILDLSRVRAGPTCVRQFSDFGADVIKIEIAAGHGSEREHGRAAPRAGLPEPAPQQARDDAQPQAARKAWTIFMRLVKTADVVVENYRPDVKFRLGIDYESLKKVNPRIILASISGFGQDGPVPRPPGLRPDRAGHGRPDVGDRAAGPGTGARRRRDRRRRRRASAPRSAS